MPNPISATSIQLNDQITRAAADGEISPAESAAIAPEYRADAEARAKAVIAPYQAFADFLAADGTFSFDDETALRILARDKRVIGGLTPMSSSTIEMMALNARRRAASLAAQGNPLPATVSLQLSVTIYEAARDGVITDSESASLGAANEREASKQARLALEPYKLSVAFLAKVGAFEEGYPAVVDGMRIANMHGDARDSVMHYGAFQARPR